MKKKGIFLGREFFLYSHKSKYDDGNYYYDRQAKAGITNNTVSERARGVRVKKR